MSQDQVLNMDEQVFTPAQLCEFLGKSKCFPAINRRSANPIPYIRIDRKAIVYRKSVVLQWLAAREHTESVRGNYPIAANRHRTA